MKVNRSGRLQPGDAALGYIEDHVVSRYSRVKIDQYGLFNIDSSLFTPDHWVLLAEKIEELYLEYDGFIVIHGTDTLAYSAAALSFMLKGLAKPVVFTGSQLPVFEIRTDAFSNLHSSIKVVLEGNLHEVAVVFNNRVYRGNRVKKRDVWDFNAFYSPNYGVLIRLGIGLEKNESLFLPYPKVPFEVDTRICRSIAVISFFPGLDLSLYIPLIADNRIKGIVIEAYGSGNIPSGDGALDVFFKKTSESRIPVAVCSQAPVGEVDFELYEAAENASFYGLISAGDMTKEASLVKLMIGLGRHEEMEDVKSFMLEDISGEREAHPHQ